MLSKEGTALQSLSAVIAASSEDTAKSVSGICSDTGIKSITLTNGENVRELCAKNSYDLALLVLPFEERFGAEAAVHISRSKSTQVIALVPSRSYDEVCKRLSGTGILILPRSCGRTQIINAVHNALHTKKQLDELREENRTLTDMVNEIRLVNRAKCVLIEYLRISEKEAHRQMQKRAMDQRTTISEVAADIIKTYEYNR